MLSEITIKNTEEFIDKIDDYVNIATGDWSLPRGVPSNSLAPGTVVNSIGRWPSLFLIFLSAPLSNRKIIIAWLFSTAAWCRAVQRLASPPTTLISDGVSFRNPVTAAQLRSLAASRNRCCFQISGTPVDVTCDEGRVWDS